MDSSQDADHRLQDSHEQEQDSGGKGDRDPGHRDDCGGKDMAAGHGVSLRVFWDQRSNVPGLVGSWAVDPGPDSTEQYKGKSRDQDRDHKTPEVPGLSEIQQKKGIRCIHCQCRGFSRCAQDKAGRTAFADAACELLISMVVSVSFAHLLL